MTDNPLMKRLERRPEHGQKAEKRAGTRLGGRLQPGSGCSPNNKGDIKTDHFLVESKSTINGSLSLKHEWLRKISGEAIAISREPALIVQFVDAQGRTVPDGGWVMVPERVFKELTSG
jgi:hypothetical protein